MFKALARPTKELFDDDALLPLPLLSSRRSGGPPPPPPPAAISGSIAMIFSVRGDIESLIERGEGPKYKSRLVGACVMVMKKLFCEECVAESWKRPRNFGGNWHNCVCPIGQVILSKKGNKKQLRELQ